MEIKLTTNSPLNCDAKTIFNSSNNFLFHRTGSAKKIRINSGKLNKSEKLKIKYLLTKISKEGQEFFKDKFEKKYNINYNSTLSALEILSKKKRLSLGLASLDKKWSKQDKRPLIHLILIRHHYKNKNHTITKNTPAILRKALKNAFKIVSKEKYKSIAIPIMVARGMYGLTPKQSYEITLQFLKKVNKNSKIAKVILCFDNPITKRYFKQIK